MMDIDDLEEIAAASQGIPLNDLQHFIRYLSSFPQEDISQDRDKLNLVVHRLQENLNKKKVCDYGYFCYV
jgi:hypothetical protein